MEIGKGLEKIVGKVAPAPKAPVESAAQELKPIAEPSNDTLSSIPDPFGTGQLPNLEDFAEPHTAYTTTAAAAKGLKPLPGGVTAGGKTVAQLSDGSPTDDLKNLPPQGVTKQPDGSYSSHWANHSDYSTPQEARQAYEQAKSRLENPSNWTGIGGVTAFTQFDASTTPPTPVNRKAKVGDVLKMTVGDGQEYYVRVDKIEEGPNGFSIAVRPTYDPIANPVKPNEIDHFFDDRATNTFPVSLEGNRVQARAVALGEYVNKTKGAGWDVYNEAVAHSAWGLAGTNNTAVQGQAQWNHFLERLTDTQNPKPLNPHNTYSKPNPFTAPVQFAFELGRPILKGAQSIVEPVVGALGKVGQLFK
jgi:hypothetical protein